MFSELRCIVSFDKFNQFNHQANIAYISAHAAPDLYSSLVLYVDYIRATFTLVLLDELILVSSISMLIWGEPIGNMHGSITWATDMNCRTIPNWCCIEADYDRFYSANNSVFCPWKNSSSWNAVYTFMSDKST